MRQHVRAEGKIDYCMCWKLFDGIKADIILI
jgi:hypothetical protein